LFKDDATNVQFFLHQASLKHDEEKFFVKNIKVIFWVYDAEGE